MSLINVYILHKCVCNHIRGGLLPTRQVQPLHDNSIQFNTYPFSYIPDHTMPLHYKSRYLSIIHSVRNMLLFLFSLYTPHGVQKKTLAMECLIFRMEHNYRNCCHRNSNHFHRYNSCCYSSLLYLAHMY